jgi:hypothetical protein
VYEGGWEVGEVEEGAVVHGGHGPVVVVVVWLFWDRGEAVCEGRFGEDAVAQRGKRLGTR